MTSVGKEARKRYGNRYAAKRAKRRRRTRRTFGALRYNATNLPRTE